MNSLLMTFYVAAMVDVTSAIKKEQVKAGTLAKFHWNGKSIKLSNGEWSDVIPQELDGQIVKIMDFEIPRSVDGKRVLIQSLTNPQLALGVKEHHLEAMELDGWLDRPELNGMTVIRTEDPVIIQEDLFSPCFRIPVQRISADGQFDGEPIHVGLENLKWVSDRVLDDCCDELSLSSLINNYEDTFVGTLLQLLYDRGYPLDRVIRSNLNMRRRMGELERYLEEGIAYVKRSKGG